MKTREEIQERINEITPKFELAQDSYFSFVKDKQEGKEVSEVDFMRIESECEIIKKEIETLEWSIDKDCAINLGDFGHILLDEHSEDVYKALKEGFENDRLVVSFKGVNSFQTTFARDTFGKIYNEIGSRKYFSIIKYEDITKTNMMLIREGIVQTIYM